MHSERLLLNLESVQFLVSLLVFRDLNSLFSQDQASIVPPEVEQFFSLGFSMG